jgi:hypothetical protein
MRMQISKCPSQKIQPTIVFRSWVHAYTCSVPLHHGLFSKQLIPKKLQGRRPSSSFRHHKLNSLSSSSGSSGSAATFTPGIYIRENGSSSNTNTPKNLILSAPSFPPTFSFTVIVCGHCDNCTRSPNSVERKDVTLAMWQILNNLRRP